MTPIDGLPILTAAQTRAAEDRAVAAGTSVDVLMQRAGQGVAEAVRRLGAGAPVLVLCGPGNNGGDGYVAARLLAAAGVAVRVAASGAPKSDAAGRARNAWGGAVEALAAAEAAPVVVDALFGTGLARPLDEADAASLGRLVQQARLSIAVDLPSGVASDDGALRSAVPAFDLTLALGAVKPAHVLEPAASRCGAVRLVDIGLRVDADAHAIRRPTLAPPGPDAHKYSRGMVAIVGGAMPGAAALAAEAALRAGAGYALLLGETAPGAPHAIVRRAWRQDALADTRIGAVVIGPGLGRDDTAREKLDITLRTDRNLVIDGDALALIDGRQLARLGARSGLTVLTPHAGEFAALFGKPERGKIAAARAAASRSGAHVVFKGPDTVIAAPDGAVIVAPRGPAWLSTAGTGDVLAGTIAAQIAAPGRPIERIAAGVWLHAEAARRLGAAFIADDLARALGAARAGR